MERGGQASPADLAALRAEEARDAARGLGTAPLLLGFPDGGLTSAPRLVPRLAELIRDTCA